MSERIHSIDTVRALALAFIVAIHADLFRGLGTAGNVANFVMDTTGRFAVPIFFLTSGYLLAAACARGGSDYVSRYVSRVTTIYAGIVLVAIPLVLLRAAITAMARGRAVEEAVAATAASALSPLGLLYYGDSVLFHFWFLPALLYAVLLIRVADAVGRLRTLLLAATGLHVVGILAELTLITIPFRTRDALFFGLFYTSVGYALRRWDVSVPRRPRAFLAAAGVLAVLQLGERYLIGYVLNDGSIAAGVFAPEYSLLTVPLVFAITGFALAAPAAGRTSVLSTIGAYSLVIYVLHPFPLFGLLAVLDMLTVHPALAAAGQLAIVAIAYVGTLGGYVLLTRVRLVRTGVTVSSRATRRAIRSVLP